MIWAALLIGVTVFLAIRTVRTPINGAAHGGPRDWLVLPDEPRAKPAGLPALPAPDVIYPSWSVCGESWRAEKPLRPWFRSPAPYAVAAAMGVVSLDLTALGLGVPEIVPTHQPLHDHATDLHHQPRDHDFSDAIWFAPQEAAALFETVHADQGGFGIDLAALGQSDFIVPTWERPHEASHDWWA